jgi:WD40 repeat protein
MKPSSPFLRAFGLFVSLTAPVFAQPVREEPREGHPYAESLTLQKRPAGAPLRTPEGTVWSVAFSPDGKTLFAAGEYATDDVIPRPFGFVRSWDVATGTRRINAGQLPTRVRATAVAPDGKVLAWGEYDWRERASIHLMDTATGDPVAIMTVERSVILGLAFSPDGKTLASSSASHTTDPKSNGYDRGEVRLWDVSSGRSSLLASRADGVFQGVSFSPDGALLAAGGRVWHVRSREERRKLSNHENDIVCLAFTPDGKSIATGGSNHMLKLWNVENGENRFAIVPSAMRERRGYFGRRTGELVETHNGHVMDIAFTPDGKFVALAYGEWKRFGSFGEVQLWNISSRSLEQVLIRASPDPMTCLCFTRDGSMLATGDGNGTVKLWKKTP